MKKICIAHADWLKLEETLKDLRVGYSVIFDDHNGTAEMIIDVQQIGVYRWNETPTAPVDNEMRGDI